MCYFIVSIGRDMKIMTIMMFDASKLFWCFCSLSTRYNRCKDAFVSKIGTENIFLFVNESMNDGIIRHRRYLFFATPSNASF